MRINVSCKCGQQFATDSRHVGKRVECLSCGGALAITAPKWASPPPIASVRVQCVCGWAFSAPAAQQGKSVHCHGCGGLTTVPLNDPLGIGYTAPDALSNNPLSPVVRPRDYTDRWAKVATCFACLSVVLLPLAVILTAAINSFAQQRYESAQPPAPAIQGTLTPVSESEKSLPKKPLATESRPPGGAI